ncbi:hypothetical protein NQ317_019381 [Molorchus minor]|uniref:Uncharacterized protein n=1 Tax=Molorchus minor TaxID=1323400 RepID=A0ABQ9JD49_9CUCU|nr:hypothetical protein NQ317_019381 [Molorchus minor]
MKINQHKISESQNFVPDLKGASECFYESSPKLYDYAEIYAPSSTPKKKYSSCKISHSRNVFEDLCNEKIGKKKIEGDSDLVSTDNSPKETDKRSGNSRRCSRNSGFSFTSDADSKEWSDIVEETTKTVSKVEQYIYDDYETFKNEDYNQIICSNNTCNSLFEKVSRLGWTYTPRHTLPKSTADNFADKNDPTKMYYHHTYFKFEDVCEKDGNLKIEYGNKPRENTPQSNSCGSLNIAFKRSDHLNIPLWDNPIYGDKEMTHDEPKTKSKF